MVGALMGRGRERRHPSRTENTAVATPESDGAARFQTITRRREELGPRRQGASKVRERQKRCH
eukprot:14004899-Alexandrium_andersonii.AAC.1